MTRELIQVKNVLRVDLSSRSCYPLHIHPAFLPDSNSLPHELDTANKRMPVSQESAEEPSFFSEEPSEFSIKNNVIHGISFI
jgi:hypothetical protein